MFLDRSPHKWLKLTCPVVPHSMKGIHCAMQEPGDTASSSCTVIVYITVVFVFHYLSRFFLKSYFYKELLNGHNIVKP